MIDYEKFKDMIYNKTGINLSCYKERQMKRRIDSLIKRNHFENYLNYYNAIDRDKHLYNEFINYLTINVSEFYRNAGQWEILEKDIFPSLLKQNSSLKIWSAACSTGEEPYTLVMVLSKLLPLTQIKILATDIDREAISKAQLGLYSAKSLVNVPAEHVNKYFNKLSDSYQIKDEVKKCVEFKHHNLLSDKYPDHLDLIVCRNVMIYFTEESKELMFKKFQESLSNHGVLFVGSTEQIILPNRFKFAPLKTFFYKKLSD